MEHYIEVIKMQIKQIRQVMREEQLQLEATNKARQNQVDMLEKLQWKMEDDLKKDAPTN